MAEIAGLVLGVVPLVIESLNYLRTVSDLITKSIGQKWVDLTKSTKLLAIYDLNQSGQSQPRSVLEANERASFHDALYDLPDQHGLCRVYFTASSDTRQQNAIDQHLKEVAPLYDRYAIKGFDSLATQWSQSRKPSGHTLDSYAIGSIQTLQRDLQDDSLISSQILTQNILRISNSVGCYRTKDNMFIVVIHLGLSGSLTDGNRKSHGPWLQDYFDNFVNIFLQEDERYHYHNSEHPQDVLVQLCLLRFYRTNLRLYSKFLVDLEGIYDKMRNHRVDPRYSTLQPSMLADVVTDAYYYNQFLDIATAMSITAKSLVYVLRTTRPDKDVTADTKCLLIETEAYCDELPSPPGRLAIRLARHIELINMSRNIQESIGARNLNLLACIFLPLSLATSLLSMSTRFIDLGPLLYDFCGVVVLFGSLLIFVFGLLKVYRWVKDNYSTNNNRFAAKLFSVISRVPLWMGVSILWSIIISSFIIGMVSDIGLGFRVLGYGLAGFAGLMLIGCSVAAFVFVTCVFHTTTIYNAAEEGETLQIEILSTLEELQREFNVENEVCFVRASAKYVIHELTTEEYFDHLIDHLREGAVRHTFDKPGSMTADYLHRADMICGAIKTTMLDPEFIQLTDEGSGPYTYPSPRYTHALSIQAHRVDSWVELQQRAAELNWQLNSLSTRLLNILMVVAYAQRHFDIFQHLSKYPAPPRSTFHQFGSQLVSCRMLPAILLGQYIDNPDCRVWEWKLWISLLRSDWVHSPLEQGAYGLFAGMCWLIDYLKYDAELRSSPILEELCEVMSKRDIIPVANTISRFLSITPGHSDNFPDGIRPCGLYQAKMILHHFPVPHIIRDEPHNGASADLALPLTYWGPDNSDRLVVMKIILEQGLDLNDRIDRRGQPPPFPTRDTVLHRAAQLGDIPMVNLLLEYGADTSILGGSNDTPAQRARANGHDQVVEILESFRGSRGAA